MNAITSVTSRVGNELLVLIDHGAGTSGGKIATLERFRFALPQFLTYLLLRSGIGMNLVYEGKSTSESTLHALLCTKSFYFVYPPSKPCDLYIKSCHRLNMTGKQ
jgi:hypothetical protein